MPEPRRARSLRGRLAGYLGVPPERKFEIYRDVARSASLRDAAYWLQMLFGAGICTFGLVLDSPAVIIGAMLISPLMGPILASGLAIAAGDLVLGARALVNIVLSSLLAVAAAALLVAALPFDRMTAEIAARTEPTTLDLAVALFSGAIGSIAVAREVRGVATSIPGVAIAVALLPPLCVVGYGVGFALTVGAAEGLRVAGGGGLLFVTNLVAITFTATVVFLLLHVDVPEVRARIVELRGDTPDSWLRERLRRLALPVGSRAIGSIPDRLLLVGLPLLVLLVPLGGAYGRLKAEILRQQERNEIRRAASELWAERFETLPSGEPRSYVDSIAVVEEEGRLVLYLRVFTSRVYIPDEREAFVRQLAARLRRPIGVVGLHLVEGPTAAPALAARAARPRGGDAPPTVGGARAAFQERVALALAALRLPPSAERLGHRVTTGGAAPVEVAVTYLADRDLSDDAAALVAESVRLLLDAPAAEVRLERVPRAVPPIAFGRDDATLPASADAALADVRRLLARHPNLRVEVTAHAEPGERAGAAVARAQAVRERLTGSDGPAPDRVTAIVGAETGREVRLRLRSALGGATPGS
jgi:uncharacterized hydrophobic protein (TIGR00271 family)